MKKVIPLSKKMKTLFTINTFIEFIIFVLSILGIHYLQPGFNRFTAAYKLGIVDLDTIDFLFAISIIMLIVCFAAMAYNTYNSIFTLNVFGLFGTNQYDSKTVYVGSNKYEYTDIKSISRKTTFMEKKRDVIVLILSNCKKVKLTCSKDSIEKNISEMNEYLIQSKNANIAN
ncbi:hypothetical protein [Mycoplasmopsis columbina]|uniref:hypothetical protein n=1 Tax=Mycoplasmopsis columbina TaxID=114881 RepID=UPI0004A75189|nr:hypothetical protein [Mycoplasmopsis columbina]VEU76726.1 Uncharacterised protein [Mycoplasmopsis columbina]